MSAAAAVEHVCGGELVAFRLLGDADPVAVGCRVLWLTVLYETIRESRRGRAAARDYIITGGRDFLAVCHLAGLKPEAVRRAAFREDGRNYAGRYRTRKPQGWEVEL